MKKIVNTVLVLVLVVFMALAGFVYYAWMVQKRSKSAAELMVQTNGQIDKVRTVALLENNYTNYIRDMLLMDQSTMPATAYHLPDSIKTMLANIQQSQEGDTASLRIVAALQTIVLEKIAYNQQILSDVTTQPALAKQLITAEKGNTLRANIREQVNEYIRTNRRKLIARVDKDNQYTRYSFWTTIIISLFTLILLLGESRYIYRLFLKLKSRTNRLYKREQSLMRLAEETELILFKSQVDGTFTSVSKRAAEMTGYTATELVGKHYSLFLDENTHSRLEEFYMNQVKTGEDYTSRNLKSSPNQAPKNGWNKWLPSSLATMAG